MLLAELVHTSEAVAATGVRRGKIDALASLLARLAPDEVEAAVAFLAGEPRQGEPGLAAVRLEVLRPLQPMLASSAGDVAEALGDLGLSSVEWKLDGVRIQLHKSGEDVAVFTRNLNDITARVPEVTAIARTLRADRVVLDGEALMLTARQRPRAFQETMSRVGRDVAEPDPELALVPWFFDVLHLDGSDLLDEPLADRLAVL
ncbi:MAG TPA: ATP-dependent DNA ligase, partial [Acidimicrobiia bacterium]|nr:ATP-dependent DNA ligase [Acidimicrobiia bacterium]